MSAVPGRVPGNGPPMAGAREGEDSGLELEARVGQALRGRGLRVAVAESCTGGLVLKRLTDLPGSSGWVEGGIVAYADRVKEEQLGVPASVLRSRGAVSEEVARAMAEGVVDRLGAGLGVAVTGITGPGGAVPGKPVGTVWFAVAVSGKTRAERVGFQGDRRRVREESAAHALRMILEVLSDPSLG